MLETIFCLNIDMVRQSSLGSSSVIDAIPLDKKILHRQYISLNIYLGRYKNFVINYCFILTVSIGTHYTYFTLEVDVFSYLVPRNVEGRSATVRYSSSSNVDRGKKVTQAQL